VFAFLALLSLHGALAEPTEPIPATSARVVYTGGLGGVGSSRTFFEALRAMSALPAPTKLEQVHAFSGAMAQGPWVMWADDHTARGTLDLFSGGEVRCDAPSPATGAVLTTDTLILDGTREPAWLSGLRQGSDPSLIRRSCSAGAARVTLVGPADAAPPDWSLPRWEFRRALWGSLQDEGGSLSWTEVGSPLQELARTAAAVTRLLGEDPGALYVDAGNLLDGASSVSDGALSLHRPNTLALARRLGPAALAPGEDELLAGARSFLSEITGTNLPYVATNWKATEAALALPASLVREVPRPGGTVRLAFLGVVDPALQGYIPVLSEEGVELTDPVTALQAEIDRLEASPTPPDAIIALTTAGADVLARIRRQVRGLDVLIGDPTLATLRVQGDELRLRPIRAGAKAAAITPPMDGLATLDLGFEDGHLASVRFAPVLVAPSDPPDAEVLARVTAVRAQVYPVLDHPLLDAPTPTTTLGQSDWEQVVCEAVRERTGADTVLLRALPPAPSQPGPLSEMMAVDALALLDTLELHEIPGDHMADLLNKAYSVAPVSCGAKPGSSSPKARGRSLEVGRVYRLVTTDRTRAGSLLDPILSSVRSGRPLDQPTWRPLLDDQGRPLTLRMATLDALRARRDERGGTDGLTKWLLEDAPAEVPPLWLLRVRAVTVDAERYRGVDDERFASVPETLATTPSSLSLDTTADVALDYSSARVQWDLRARAAYGLLSVSGETADETADDLILSTSLGLPRYAFPADGKLPLMPYSELRLDSELTPTEGNPRQEDLSLLAGLAGTTTTHIPGFHVGVLVAEDLTDAGLHPEIGARADLATWHKVGSVLRITTDSDLLWLARTAHDDASDLALRASTELKLSFPLAYGLDMAWYARGFALTGRVPETEHLGYAWALGASLDLASAFELGRPL